MRIKNPTKSLWLCLPYGNNRGVTTHRTSKVSPHVSSLSSTFLYAYVSSFGVSGVPQGQGSGPLRRSGRGRETKNGRRLGGSRNEKMTTSWCISPSCYKTAVAESIRTDWRVKAARQKGWYPSDREHGCMTRNLQEEATTDTRGCSQQTKIKTGASTLQRHEIAFWRASLFPVTTTRRRRYIPMKAGVNCYLASPTWAVVSLCEFFFFFSFCIMNKPSPTNGCAVNKHQVCIWQLGYKGFAQILSSSPGVIQLQLLLTFFSF